MYYDLEVAAHDSTIFGGGTQDNGSWMTGGDGDIKEHHKVGAGDGGWMVIHPRDAGHYYVSSQQMAISRTRPGESEPRSISPLPADDPERAAMWMVFLAMDPEDPKSLLTGTTRIWRTHDGGETWSPPADSAGRRASPALDGSAITAIEINRSDRQRIYVGTEYGGFFRSLNGGETWDDSPLAEDRAEACNLAGGVLPGRTITRIRSHPFKPDTVYVTIANFGT
ncbi:MAG: hypothetical protein GY953_20175, partial [bacterium]|nr:hypothetical protein [bacterium]